MAVQRKGRRGGRRGGRGKGQEDNPEELRTDVGFVSMSLLRGTPRAKRIQPEYPRPLCPHLLRLRIESSLGEGPQGSRGHDAPMQELFRADKPPKDPDVRLGGPSSNRSNRLKVKARDFEEYRSGFDRVTHLLQCARAIYILWPVIHVSRILLSDGCRP